LVGVMRGFSEPVTTTSSMDLIPTAVVAGCREFYTLQSGEGCKDIESRLSITLAQLFAWNPISKFDIHHFSLFYLGW
jgi:hypothetical protein